jgi:hypothetical protein
MMECICCHRRRIEGVSQIRFDRLVELRLLLAPQPKTQVYK